MKKLLTVFCVLGVFSAPAQTLFTYGKQSVSADEFLRAYRKNNGGSTGEKAMREYLDLYVASRLKVAEAKEQKLDTLPQLKTDLAALRQQILPSYINDKESLNGLVKEAFARQQKDVHVAHVFIAFTKNGVTDTVAAAQKRAEVLGKLSKGLAFDEAARQYSDDPSALTNGGDIGWITAFTLPYELESLIYTTPVGKTSAAYSSKAGYHIFKNLGERKALGRMKAAQILLAFPPGADDAYKARLKKTADSIYNRLQAGDDFGKLATAFSNDVVSAASNGQMPEFAVGEYNPVFEAAVFALPKDGAISRPFVTEHGYHIVKRLGLTPLSASLTPTAEDVLRMQVEGSDRMLITKSVVAQKVLKGANYKTLLASNDELWAFTDSALNYVPPKRKLTINPATPALRIGDRTAMVKEWLDFAQTLRYRANGAVKTYPVLWNEFVQATALRYYEDHLEEYNPEFKRQITEFADGNLFFEIMQRKVWTPAQTDSTALLSFYQKHRAAYVWKQSADAVLFYANDSAAGRRFYGELRKNPSAWKTTLNNYAEVITSDSSRFELAQIPKAEKETVKPGALTAPMTNPADNTVSFAYILRLYNAEESRNFTDAKGLVINDYQAELEKAWIAALKKKYPVTVNEKVLGELVRASK